MPETAPSPARSLTDRLIQFAVECEGADHSTKSITASLHYRDALHIVLSVDGRNVAEVGGSGQKAGFDALAEDGVGVSGNLYSATAETLAMVSLRDAKTDTSLGMLKLQRDGSIECLGPINLLPGSSQR